MFQKEISKINEDLKRTKKAIIALGCSYAEGQGAVDDELYTNYTWTHPSVGEPLDIKITLKERGEILKKYPILTPESNGKINFRFMERENSFVSVLCKKYFNGEYTPINFGVRGCGNRATIKELSFYPSINWDIIEEIIVVFMPSGLERFDFINDEVVDGSRWKAMWPHYNNMPDGPRKTLWEGYSKALYSDRFLVMEQLAHAQELLTWCKANNAKLIITPAFDDRYNKKFFQEQLDINVFRDHEGNFLNKKVPVFKSEMVSNFIHMFPWENMFKPDGYDTMAKLTIAQEKTIEDANEYFFQFIGKGSPNLWMTACAHPSAKAHDLYAKKLHQHILNLK
jgi:hypothetical protein